MENSNNHLYTKARERLLKPSKLLPHSTDLLPLKNYGAYGQQKIGPVSKVQQTYLQF